MGRKLTIKFVIDLDGDSEANIRPQDVEALRAYGVMGLDWLQDIMADTWTTYDNLYGEVFGGKFEDHQ